MGNEFFIVPLNPKRILSDKQKRKAEALDRITSLGRDLKIKASAEDIKQWINEGRKI
jgi:hypothetical protein